MMNVAEVGPLLPPSGRDRPARMDDSRFDSKCTDDRSNSPIIRDAKIKHAVS